MSNEATTGWIFGVTGFLAGGMILSLVATTETVSVVNSRWERQCVARGVGTYAATGDFKWTVNVKAEPSISEP